MDSLGSASFADTETITGPGRRKTTMAEGKEAMGSGLSI
jgi:hypothetical protein